MHPRSHLCNTLLVLLALLAGCGVDPGLDEADDALSQTGNLLQNPGFEHGSGVSADGWSEWRVTSHPTETFAQRTSAHAYRGSYGVRTQAERSYDSTEYSGVSTPPLAVVGGDRYTFRVYARCVQGTGYVQVDFPYAGTASIDHAAENGDGKTSPCEASWHRVKVSFAVPPDRSSMIVSLMAGPNGAEQSTYDWDAASLVRTCGGSGRACSSDTDCCSGVCRTSSDDNVVGCQ